MSTSEMTAEQFSGTISGFDREAIARAYKKTYSQLAADSTSGVDQFTFVEALVFVDLRRKGAPDKDAFTAARELTQDELGEYFTVPDSDAGDVDETAYVAAAKDLSRWCLMTGRSVDEYRSLDEVHRAAFIDQAIALGIVTEKAA